MPGPAARLRCTSASQLQGWRTSSGAGGALGSCCEVAAAAVVPADGGACCCGVPPVVPASTRQRETGESRARFLPVVCKDTNMTVT